MVHKFLLSMFAILAQAIALADGGTVQFRQDAGGLVITVFTAPAPLSAGTVDISVLVQNREGLEPVLDADVSLLLLSTLSNEEIRARATRELAQNKLLYAAPIALNEPGKWHLTATISRNGERTTATGTIDVGTAPGGAASYWGYIALPPVMITAFGVREYLIRRKAKG